MKRNFLCCTLTLISILAAIPVRAGSHTWSGAVNNSWSNAGNWSAGGAPQFGEANIVLVFPPGAVRYAATNGVGNYAIDEIVISGNNYTLGGYGITLTGVAYYNLDCSGTNNLIALDMTLNSSLEYFNVGTYDSLTLSGALSGPGGFKKFGRGTLTLTGPANNNYATATTVMSGILDLAKPAFTTAIPGDLIIGDPVLNSYLTEVSLENNHQIDDSADVTVNPSCIFYLQGRMEVIHSLHLAEGSVYSDISPALPGQLTIFGGVTVSNSYPQPSSIAGHFSLAGAIRTIDLSDLSQLQVSAVVVDGGQTAGILKTGTGTLVLSGANTYSGSTTVQNGTLWVKNSSGLGSGAGSAYVQSGATLELDAVSVIDKHLYLNGPGYVPFFQTVSGALHAAGNASWTGPVTLQSASTILVETNLNLTLSGIIDGPGQLRKDGDGDLTLAGSNANTFNGGTYVDAGRLNLGKTASVAAVPGALFIGVTNGAANFSDIPKTNQVRLLSSQQIADAAPIYMQANGLLDLNGYNETIGALTMIGSIITNSGGGVLTLNGNVTGECPWNNFPVIAGNVSLGGATRTFTTLNPGAIELPGVVSDGGSPAGIIKMGTIGGLRLDGTNNTYSGVTTINEGWLSVQQPGSLGSPVAGTVVNNGGEFTVGLNFHGPVETLTMNGGRLYSVGYNSWDGNIVLNGDAQVDVDTAANDETLDINGVISGPGSLTLIVGGTLRLGGLSPNTYTGPTTVLGSTAWNTDSTLELRKPAGVTAIAGALIVGSATNPANHEIVRYFAPNQIADSAPITVNASGLFDLNNQYDIVGSLAGSGNVNLIFGALTAGGNNADTTFSGTIFGIGFVPLTKEGTGSMTLTGTNTCSGKMVVNNGHLYINGSQTCGVEVNTNGKLHGQGTIGAITGLGGWTVPGDNLVAPVHGQLKSASLILDPTSDFNVDLGGTAASGNYDRLKVIGTVAISNVTLHVTQSGMAKTNDQFVIIDNDGADPIGGTFAGYPENSILNLGPSQVVRISYVGGDGNDVVLTQIATPPAPTIGDITKLGNGDIQLTGTGVTGWVYSVEATENVNAPNSWQTIGTATADGNGALQFVDPDAPNHSMRFYRFRSP